MNKLMAFARSRLGRALLALFGLAVIFLLIRSLGAAEVLDAMKRALPVLWVLIVFEAVVIVADVATLWLLYRAPRPPLKVIIRATLIGYTLAVVAPAGRTVAEGVKATMLAPFAGGARATMAAGRIQALVVLSAAVLSLGALFPAMNYDGARTAAIAIAVNTLATGVLGLGLLTAGKRLNVGRFVGKLWRRAESLGPEMDALWRAEPTVPLVPMGWQMIGRACTIAQIGLLISALSGKPFDFSLALLASGLFLVGASVGGIIPAQLGANEANFVLCAPLLGITTSDAIAIPMLIRAAQIVWALVGLAVPLVWRRPEPT